MKSQEMIIEPSQAVRWLEASDTNYRPINDNYVKHLAQQIRDGNWEFNGETIKFNEKNQVVDGQHRLWACIIADKPIRSMVIFGVESVREADRGRPRRLADELRFMGENNTSAMAALLNRIIAHERVGVGAFRSCKASVTESLDCLRRYPECRDVVKAKPKLRLLTTGVHFFFKWLFGKIDTAESDAFFTDLYEGENLKASDPAYVLRRYFLRLLASDGAKTLNTESEMAVVIKAWNARRANETLTAISWRRFGPAAENFPDVDGDKICRRLAKPKVAMQLEQRMTQMIESRSANNNGEAA